MSDNAIATMKLNTLKNEYYAVFYSDSVVISVFEKTVRKEMAKELKRLIKQNKIKLLKRGQFSDEYWKAYEDETLSKEKQALLAENSDNVEYRYGEITNVCVKPYRTHTTKAHETPPIAGQIYFVCGESEHHYNHKYKKEDEKLEMLSSLFTHKYHFSER